MTICTQLQINNMQNIEKNVTVLIIIYESCSLQDVTSKHIKAYQKTMELIQTFT